MSTINLLPDDYLRRRNQRRANVLCFILFLFVMAGVGVAAIASRTALAQTRKLQRQVATEYADAAKLIEEMQQLEMRKKTLLEKAEETASLMERVPRSYLLGTITNARPESVSLISLDLETVSKGATPPAVPKTGAKRSSKGKSKAAVVDQGLVKRDYTYWVELSLTGVAETDVDVARYIASLARHPLMYSVDLVHSKEIRKGDFAMRAFELKIKTEPNADVMDIKKRLAQEEQLVASSVTRSQR